MSFKFFNPNKWTKKNQKRFCSFFTPEGEPKMIRVYDNFGTKLETNDRFTIVFTGRYRHKTAGEFLYMGANTYGHYHESNNTQIDRPAYSHLGKKKTFNDLPERVQSAVIATYLDLWNFS